MARISRTGTTDSTGVASTTVTGSGGGRLKFISRNGSLWSNSYEIDDYFWYDDGISNPKTVNWYTPSSNFNVDIQSDGTVFENTGTSTLHSWANNFVALDIGAFIVEFDLISYTDSVSSGFRFYGQNSHQIYFKNMNCPQNCKVKFIVDGEKIKYQIDDGNIVDFITTSETSFQIGFRFIGRCNVKFKDFKVYPFFTAPQHYTPIALSSSASIIQTGETATLTAELTNVIGEKLASKSVNFIEKVEHLYEHTGEVSQVYNSGQNVTVLSPSISRTDLGTSWTLSFDMRTDCESRVFIGNSASAVPTNPQYSIFMGRDTSNVISYGFRITTTTVTASSVASTSYHSCKIVFNNGTITYYVDDTQVGTKTVSFYGNYDNYVVGLVAWGTGTLYAKNITLDNGSGGDILIGTGTTNSQGVATTTITFNGTGERQFISQTSDGMILSETFSVYDCLKYEDDASEISNSIFSKGNGSDNASLTRENGYTNFSEITTGTDCTLYTKIYNQCAIEFDMQMVSTSYIRQWGALGQSPNAQTRVRLFSPSGKQDGNWHHFKIIFDNGTGSIAIDNETPTPMTVTGYDSSSDMYFRFITKNEITGINFKGFKVYSI